MFKINILNNGHFYNLTNCHNLNYIWNELKFSIDLILRSNEFQNKGAL